MTLWDHIPTLAGKELPEGSVSWWGSAGTIAAAVPVITDWMIDQSIRGGLN